MPPENLRQHHARHAIKRVIAKEMMGMVGTPGLEPGRPIKPTDFKSVVFTNFTMPPKKQLATAVSLGFVLQRSGWRQRDKNANYVSFLPEG